MEPKELDDKDIDEGQVVLEAEVCNGANLTLCMTISHPDLDPERHPPMCQVCLSYKLR